MGGDRGGGEGAEQRGRHRQPRRQWRAHGGRLVSSTERAFSSLMAGCGRYVPHRVAGGRTCVVQGHVAARRVCWCFPRLLRRRRGLLVVLVHVLLLLDGSSMLHAQGVELGCQQLQRVQRVLRRGDDPQCAVRGCCRLANRLLLGSKGDAPASTAHGPGCDAPQASSPRTQPATADQASVCMVGALRTLEKRSCISSCTSNLLPLTCSGPTSIDLRSIDLRTRSVAGTVADAPADTLSRWGRLAP